MKLFSVSLCLFLFANTVFASSQADLEAAARKEGALNLFTNGLEYGFVLERAFRARYPEIKIQHTVFQPAGPRYYDHSMMENEKSEFRADVVLRCQDRDLTEWVDSDWMADLSDLPNWSRRPKHIEDDSRYVYFLGAPHVLVYNPAKIKEGDLPKNYGELLDPKWKGKISLRSPLRGNSAAFFAHFIQANHVGITWFEKLSANHPFVGQSS